ncbi:electron transfer flavoprotein subunit alpha/FixB family protein [Sphingobium sp. SJ10-10]|uniref:electron transfer flavoprotein subunit alpha/FixB family protein n=1 Tax=Sphingobium sp. SJ10-10 TaxID=3114999 RepID=UPI002E1870CF|nr:electron transfer flavoprotein subunit alpha/FixB family protein [Sphingobium sp. SJ10-10]
MKGWQCILVAIGVGSDNDSVPDWPSDRSLLILPATPEGEALAGVLAARLDAVLLGRLTEIGVDGDALVARRPSYGGRILFDLRLTQGIAVATMNEPPACDRMVTLAAPGISGIDHVELPARDAALEGARLVVSGGRGLDADSFATLGQIAQRLDGALGASLPAVDLGLAPVSRQIGQSGHFVTPRLYLAAGISGTPQHLAGIGMASRIIAINSDADAPIFRYAEVGMVADAKILLPLVLQSLEEQERNEIDAVPQS